MKCNKYLPNKKYIKIRTKKIVWKIKNAVIYIYG